MLSFQSLRSAGALDSYTPRQQKEIFKQNLIYSGPVIWNNLPDCLKNLETVDIVLTLKAPITTTADEKF